MRWLALPALLLATTLLGLLPPPRTPAAPIAVPVEALPALSADLEALARTRAEIEAERQRLRALGRSMAGVLDERQAAWLAAHRDDVSLNLFEKPYWTRLDARLRR